MNQSKLDVVKQEVARLNINILGSSEPKWMRMGKVKPDDNFIYYYGQEFHRINGIALIDNKSLKCSIWMQPKKQQTAPISFPRQTIWHYSNPGLCPTTKAEEAEVKQFYEDLQNLLEYQKKVSFSS